jgi:nicotinamidase-related amidase
MPTQDDLHGSAPDNHKAALLLIDVVNGFEFPGGEQIFRNALPLAGAIRKLKALAGKAGVPVIYVNDNFGRWQSSFEQLLEHCVKPGIRGKPFVEQVRPAANDYFVLKPKQSGFYQTPLAIPVETLGNRARDPDRRVRQ